MIRQMTDDGERRALFYEGEPTQDGRMIERGVAELAAEPIPMLDFADRDGNNEPTICGMVHDVQREVDGTVTGRCVPAPPKDSVLGADMDSVGGEYRGDVYVFTQARLRAVSVLHGVKSVWPRGT